MIVCFGNCEVDLDRRELHVASNQVHVEPQVFDLLAELIDKRDRVVSKDEIIESVWHGRIVSEATLSSRINAARQAIGDSGKAQTWIRTIPRRGFRFVGDVRTRTNAVTVPADEAPARRRTSTANSRPSSRSRSARLPTGFGLRSRWSARGPHWSRPPTG